MNEGHTKFERARIIGARALQIARGAPLTIKTDLKDPIKIAEFEYNQGTLPMGIRKKMPVKLELS